MIAAAPQNAPRRRGAHTGPGIHKKPRAPPTPPPPVLQAAYLAVVASEVANIGALPTQIENLGAVVGEHFGRHRDAEIYLSLPGLGLILGARVLGEFGDDPDRHPDAKARKNKPGPHPTTNPPAPRRGSPPPRHTPQHRRRHPPTEGVLPSPRGTRGARLPPPPRHQHRPRAAAPPAPPPPPPAPPLPA